MSNLTYENKREELQTYFDRTAKDKWVALTSNTPVSKIRETVRKGREEMRNTLLELQNVVLMFWRLISRQSLSKKRKNVCPQNLVKAA